MQSAAGPFLYLACLVIAWYHVRASVIANTALALSFALPPSLMGKRNASPAPIG